MRKTQGTVSQSAISLVAYQVRRASLLDKRSFSPSNRRSFFSDVLYIVLTILHLLWGHWT